MEKTSVWVGLKNCGCCVAIVADVPEHKRDVEKSKRGFLKDGLSVVHATWKEWQDKYLPTFGKCKHE